MRESRDRSTRKSVLETVKQAPPDPILGLAEAFNKDVRPNKVNLTVGVYKAEDGTTPVLESVRVAEQRRWTEERQKTYRPINGDPQLGVHVQGLVFGPEHPVVTLGRAATAHTPGGTGALRVAGDLIHAVSPSAKVWLSSPTWANHPNIFRASGLQIESYPYYDSATHGLAYEDMLEALRKARPGDIVLLHACCHNPTGVDPSVEQWRGIAATLRDRGLLPVVDFAYQGFGSGLREDSAGLRVLLEEGPEEVFVCSSFSKNFGLYCERAGALTVVASTREIAANVLSQMKTVIRCNYSNPPAHGGSVVNIILSNEELRSKWQGELSAMRDRIRSTRHSFVNAMQQRGLDMNFVGQQNGMFSYSGLNKNQVEALRVRHGIYIVGSGRINVAGLNARNIEQVCDAIAEVSA